MNLIEINTFDYLKDNKIAYVKVSDLFKRNLKNKILDKYGTLTNYNNEKLKICLHTLAFEFRINKYFKFDRLLKIIKDFDISKEEIYNEISAFFAKGSNTAKELILPKELNIDEFFIEGYSLYLAEGDNGSNGNTIPRKLRFANSELRVHKLFIRWLRTYFPNNYFYFNIIIRHDDKNFNIEDIRHVKKYLELNYDQIRVSRYKWKRNTQRVYKTCLDNALLIDFVLAIKNKIKKLCNENKIFAAAYLRGMMIGEGTAYFNRSRYVRIEMKNEEEIKYIHKLFSFLGFDCKPYLRTEREGMWSIYIGAKQLRKYYDKIGFGVHHKRQAILKRAVNKKLKVNQFG